MYGSVAELVDDLFGVFSDIDDFLESIAALDFPSFGFGDLADTGPAISPRCEKILNTVDVSSLIFAFFLCSFVALLVS